MYHNRIDLILTFLGLFLITNVFGAPGASSLATNQTSTSKSATKNTTSQGSIESSDHGKMDFFLCKTNGLFDLDSEI